MSQARYACIFLPPDVIEFEYSGVGLSAIHTRMRGEIFSGVLFVLETNGVLVSGRSLYVFAFVAKIVPAGTGFLVFWIFVWHDLLDSSLPHHPTTVLLSPTRRLVNED